MISQKIDSKFSGMMLREYLYEQLNFSHNLVKKAKSEEGNILINNERKTVRYVLQAGDELHITFPPEKVSPSLEKNNMPLSILYEDRDIIVLDKDAGVPSIPSRNHPSGTIANGLLAYYEKNHIRSTIHIVTRLDKETSGSLLIAKHQYSHSILSNMQRKHKVKRKYIAIVEGTVTDDSGTIDAPIGRKENSIIERAVVENGKRAITHFTVLDKSLQHTLVEIELETGRTHQIRVHFSYIGHPLVGDYLYGTDKSDLVRTALHCSEISFPHPFTHEKLAIHSPIHKDMDSFLASNFKNRNG